MEALQSWLVTGPGLEALSPLVLVNKIKKYMVKL
jgi:hypothetical protein